jgi:hypothetical protein
MIMIPLSSSRPHGSLSGSDRDITGTLIMIGITTAIVAVIIAGGTTAVEIIAVETTMAATVVAAIPTATAPGNSSAENLLRAHTAKPKRKFRLFAFYNTIDPGRKKQSPLRDQLVDEPSQTKPG